MLIDFTRALGYFFSTESSWAHPALISAGSKWLLRVVGLVLPVPVHGAAGPVPRLQQRRELAVVRPGGDGGRAHVEREPDLVAGRQRRQRRLRGAPRTPGRPWRSGNIFTVLVGSSPMEVPKATPCAAAGTAGTAAAAAATDAASGALAPTGDAEPDLVRTGMTSTGTARSDSGARRRQRGCGMQLRPLGESGARAPAQRRDLGGPSGHPAWSRPDPGRNLLACRGPRQPAKSGCRSSTPSMAPTAATALAAARPSP